MRRRNTEAPVFPNLRSRDELVEHLRSLSPAELKRIEEWVWDYNVKRYGEAVGTSSPRLLFHGSPLRDLRSSGLNLAKGRRGGFMGSVREVQNLAIFLTDSRRMADYFGENRSENRDYTVYEVVTNLDRMLDATNPVSIPAGLRRVGLRLVNAWDGGRKTRLANRDLWWLLDQPEFVAALKSAGFTSVKFKEAAPVNREADAFDASTYAILDPKDVVVMSKRTAAIDGVDGLWKFLESKRVNPFLAKPVKFHGHPAGGTHQLPGFHTASSRDQALPYAHQKGGAMDPDNNIDDDCEECEGEGVCAACLARQRIVDYPVVVSVDMSGLEPEHDVDARHVLMNLRDAARDALESDDPIRYFMDGYSEGQETPGSVEVALFQTVARHEEDPAGSFGSFLEDLPEDEALDAIRLVAAGGREAAQLVMRVIGQFRYLKDVSADRILSVDYVMPIWDKVLDYQGDEEDEEKGEALRASGWDTFDMDDILHFSASFKRVWKREPPAGARIEWHGTGYRNLLLAAPELIDKLPVPPLPFTANA